MNGDLVKLLIDLISMGIGYVSHERYQKKKRELMRELIDKYPSKPILEVKIPNPPSVSLDTAVETKKVKSGEEPCEPCAVKHLLSSKTFVIEAKPRGKEEKQAKMLEAYRELQAAEQHLVDEHPDLAKEIRNLRKSIEKCALLGEECDEIDTYQIDILIKKIIPRIPREYYFKPIEAST